MFKSIDLDHFKKTGLVICKTTLLQALRESVSFSYVMYSSSKWQSGRESVLKNQKGIIASINCDIKNTICIKIQT